MALPREPAVWDLPNAARAWRRASTVVWSSSISQSRRKSEMLAKSLNLSRPFWHTLVEKATAATRRGVAER